MTAQVPNLHDVVAREAGVGAVLVVEAVRRTGATLPRSPKRSPRRPLGLRGDSRRRPVPRGNSLIAGRITVKRSITRVGPRTELDEPSHTQAIALTALAAVLLAGRRLALVEPRTVPPGPIQAGRSPTTGPCRTGRAERQLRLPLGFRRPARPPYNRCGRGPPPNCGANDRLAKIE